MGAHAASCPVALLQIIQQGDALFEVFQFIGHPAGVSSQQDVPTRGMLFARCLWAGRLGGVVVGGAIPFPVAGVVGAPLTCAVAADLAMFRIDGELEVAALGATLLLAGRIGARGLLRVKSGWLELPVAKTATPLIHPFTVTVHSIQLPEMDSADCSALQGLLIWLQRSA